MYGGGTPGLLGLSSVSGKQQVLKGLPWWSSGYSVLQLQGTQVQSLVRELRFPHTCLVVCPKQNKTKQNQHTHNNKRNNRYSKHTWEWMMVIVSETPKTNSMCKGRLNHLLFIFQKNRRDVTQFFLRKGTLVSIQWNGHPKDGKRPKEQT